MNVTDEIKAHLHLIRCFADEIHERNYGDKKLYIKQQADRIEKALSLAPQVKVNADTLLRLVMEAVVSCSHEIGHDAVVLKFSERQKGHNAYNQLNTRVRNAIASALEGNGHE